MSCISIASTDRRAVKLRVVDTLKQRLLEFALVIRAIIQFTPEPKYGNN